MQIKRMNKIGNTAKRAERESLTKGRSRYKGLKVKLHRAWKYLMRGGAGCIGLMSAILLTSCDAHREEPDMSIKVGYILCTDGHVMPLSECESRGKEPIAVVFYVKSPSDEGISGSGYAVYLRDLHPEAFADSLGVAQGTSADVTAYDGNSNTFAIYASGGCGSPAGLAVFDMWRYGQSAYIGSVSEMRLLYQSKNRVNGVITALGGDPLPDNADESWYWTSTEVDGQQTAKAWLYSLGSGAMQETPKLQPHKVRPIVTLNE